MSTKERPMTPKEFQEYKKSLEATAVDKDSFSIEKNYPKGEFECFSLVKQSKDSALYLVVKLTFKDGKLVKNEAITNPEYKAFAFLKFKALLQQSMMS